MIYAFWICYYWHLTTCKQPIKWHNYLSEIRSNSLSKLRFPLGGPFIATLPYLCTPGTPSNRYTRYVIELNHCLSFTWQVRVLPNQLACKWHTEYWLRVVIFPFQKPTSSGWTNSDLYQTIGPTQIEASAFWAVDDSWRVFLGDNYHFFALVANYLGLSVVVGCKDNFVDRVFIRDSG